MKTVQSKNIYVPVPVTEETPQESGWYNVLTDLNPDKPVGTYYTRQLNEWGGLIGVTHWLRREELYVFTQDELDKHRLSIINDYNDKNYFK